MLSVFHGTPNGGASGGLFSGDAADEMMIHPAREQTCCTIRTQKWYRLESFGISAETSRLESNRFFFKSAFTFCTMFFFLHLFFPWSRQVIGVLQQREDFAREDLASLALPESYKG